MFAKEYEKWVHAGSLDAPRLVPPALSALQHAGLQGSLQHRAGGTAAPSRSQGGPGCNSALCFAAGSSYLAHIKLNTAPSTEIAFLDLIDLTRSWFSPPMTPHESWLKTNHIRMVYDDIQFHFLSGWPPVLPDFVEENEILEAPRHTFYSWCIEQSIPTTNTNNKTMKKTLN